MQPLLVLSILLVVLFSADGHAREAGCKSAGVKVCHLKSIPIQRQVNYLTIHPDAHVVAYTFLGEIGRAGGFRAIDYVSGAEVDALPARSQHYVHMKLSPSGKRLAFAQTEKGESALKIGDLDGSKAKVCAASSSYYRPLAFSFDEQLLLALSSEGNDHQIILCNSAGRMRSWTTTTVLERMKESLTLRVHGRPSWMLDTASLSSDGKQILSVRTDGQLVYLYATRQKLYLVYLKPSGVAIVSARSGEVVAEVPVTAAVSALSMSQDGTMLGVAQHGSLELWQLVQEGMEAKGVSGACVC
jgi:WD40 repeat protein